MDASGLADTEPGSPTRQPGTTVELPPGVPREFAYASASADRLKEVFQGDLAPTLRLNLFERDVEHHILLFDSVDALESYDLERFRKEMTVAAVAEFSRDNQRQPSPAEIQELAQTKVAPRVAMRAYEYSQEDVHGITFSDATIGVVRGDPPNVTGHEVVHVGLGDLVLRLIVEGGLSFTQEADLAEGITEYVTRTQLEPYHLTYGLNALYRPSSGGSMDAYPEGVETVEGALGFPFVSEGALYSFLGGGELDPVLKIAFQSHVPQDPSSP